MGAGLTAAYVSATGTRCTAVPRGALGDDPSRSWVELEHLREGRGRAGSNASIPGAPRSSTKPGTSSPVSPSRSSRTPRTSRGPGATATAAWREPGAVLAAPTPPIIRCRTAPMRPRPPTGPSRVPS
ncbi:hypothetical protein NKH77_18855 [Streptomyces sp. M19]